MPSGYSSGGTAQNRQVQAPNPKHRKGCILQSWHGWGELIESPACGKCLILWLWMALCMPFRARVVVRTGNSLGLWMDLTWDKLYGMETRLTCLGRGGHLRAVWLVYKTQPLRERSSSLLDWKTSWNNLSFTNQYIRAGSNNILALTGSDTEEGLSRELLQNWLKNTSCK